MEVDNHTYVKYLLKHWTQGATGEYDSRAFGGNREHCLPLLQS